MEKKELALILAYSGAGWNETYALMSIYDPEWEKKIPAVDHDAELKKLVKKEFPADVAKMLDEIEIDVSTWFKETFK